LNNIYGLKENRSYLVRRLTEVLYMLFLLAALLLTLIAHGFGREIAAFFARQTLPLLRLIARILQFRGLILLILLTALFTAIFCTLPNKKLHTRSAFPGAALAALGWLIFTRVFSYYARISNSYSTLYGSLSTIAMGMFWLYICISILFYGSILNLWLERRK
jgi:membrane protein